MRPTLAMLNAPRVLAVGDALRTDIAGAAAVGLDALWVLGGLHGTHPDGAAGEAAAANLSPRFTILSLTW